MSRPNKHCCVFPSLVLVRCKDIGVEGPVLDWESSDRRGKRGGNHGSLLASTFHVNIYVFGSARLYCQLLYAATDCWH